jgi:hypothetical protein
MPGWSPVFIGSGLAAIARRNKTLPRCRIVIRRERQEGGARLLDRARGLC